MRSTWSVPEWRVRVLRIVELLGLLGLFAVQTLKRAPQGNASSVGGPHLALFAFGELVLDGEGDVAIRDDERVVKDLGDGHGEQDEVAGRVDGKVLLQRDREPGERRVRIVGREDARQGADAVGT